MQVSIGLPERDPESPHGDWRCPFRVMGIDASKVRYAYGVDAFQALIMALAGIRGVLETRRRDLKWFGSAFDLNDAFPRFMPSGYGLAFSRRLEKLVDREVHRLNRKLERRASKRAGPKRQESGLRPRRK